MIRQVSARARASVRRTENADAHPPTTDMGPSIGNIISLKIGLRTVP